jgi:hypothetical protein
MKKGALLLFAATAGIAGTVLVVDSYRTRPREIPAPVYADSLAGVVVRVAGSGDSTLVHRVTWWQSPDKTLGWFKTDEYAYQGPSQWRDLTPMGAHADLQRNRITFAQGQLRPALVKHELVHILLHLDGHPSAVFQRVETYRGR